ncbi:secreted RxLR effector protein 161-like, partial [Cicer arietinum]|uniref:secreted RxLR effector protein 161-like n=1 Tax=Cicer arietinum TaxID=3827 RepID=UPI003CC5DFEA
MDRVPYASVVRSLMHAMICTRPDIAQVVGEKFILVEYYNSYMTGDIYSGKSTSGYMIKFVEGVVAWQSILHKCVALCKTEAKFIAITDAWICDVLEAKLLELAKVHTYLM